MLTQAYLQHFLHLANLFLPFLFVIQYGVDDFCIHNQVFKRSADVDGVNVVVNNLNGLYSIVLPTTCSFFSFLANTTLIRLRCLLPILLLCIMYIQATNVQVFAKNILSRGKYILIQPIIWRFRKIGNWKLQYL